MKSRILIFAALLLLPVLALAQASTPLPPPVPHPPGGGNVYFDTRGPGDSGKPKVYFRAGGPEDLGTWWKNSEIVRQLQLSDAQIKQIEQRFLNARLDLIKMRADVEIQETILQSLVDADQMDEGKISAQLDQMLAARNRLEKAAAMMMLDIRKVLTVEQWKKLRELQQARERAPMGGVRGGGPQGPGPGPGPGTPPPPDAPDDL